jgi:hypothetical protein
MGHWKKQWDIPPNMRDDFSERMERQRWCESMATQRPPKEKGKDNDSKGIHPKPHVES